MASIDDGELYLCIDGVSEIDLQRGIRAVRSVLQEADLTAEDAIAGNLARDIFIDTAHPLDELSDRERRAAEAWDRAHDAVRACLRDDVPIDLGLVRELEEVAAELDCGPHYQMPEQDGRQLSLI